MKIKEVVMKNRRVQFLIGICAILLLSGGVLYMRKDQQPQRVKKQYDAYMAQLDAYAQTHGLSALSEASEGASEYDAILDKALAAEDYLRKHAPHLLKPAEDTDVSYSREAYIAYLRKTNPAAAAKLEAELAEIDREYEAKRAEIDAEADRFEQEYLDHQVEMKEDAKRREAWEQERQVFWQEVRADRKRLDKFIDELRSHLDFDGNGKVIGIKSYSILDLSESPSVSARDTDANKAPADVSENPPVELPAPVENRTPDASSPVDNPQLWRQTVTTQMASIHNGFYEKYPDVMIRPYLTEVEYQTYFPDAASRQQLQKRTDTLQTAYANRIRTVYDKTPRERQATLLEIAQESLSITWDADFVDAVINKVREDKE